MELGNLIFGHSRGEYPIERGGDFERELQRLFDVLPDPSLPRLGPDPGESDTFENEMFAVRSYWWGDCVCPDDAHAGSECGACRPNFEHKPSGYELRWYKRPLRDSYANKPLAIGDFRALIDECIASIR